MTRKMQTMVKQNALTTVEAHRRINYCPETGEFRWRSKPNLSRVVVGGIAGRVTKNGYRQIKIGGYSHQAHRLAWLLMTGEWPPEEVDHRNRNKDDNRWDNLRLATRGQNRQNARRSKNNQSGVKGIRLKTNDKGWEGWEASINGIYLGTFETKEEATAARLEAEETYHGEYARNEARI